MSTGPGTRWVARSEGRTEAWNSLPQSLQEEPTLMSADLDLGLFYPQNFCRVKPLSFWCFVTQP